MGIKNDTKRTYTYTDKLEDLNGEGFLLDDGE
jgi:hypothetical protein